MQRIKSTLHYAGLILILVLTLFPFYMLITMSLKHTDQRIHDFWGISLPLRFDNYISAFHQTIDYLLNSIFISSSIAICVVIISSLAGYSFMRFNYPGKNFLLTIIMSLLLVPGFLLLIPQFLLIRDMGLLNTYMGQIFPPVAYGAAMATYLMYVFFDGLPRSLLEAADTEGAGELYIFLKIVMPLSFPVISTVVILNFLYGWNLYIWPLVIITSDSVKPVILILNTLVGDMNQGIGVKLAGYVIAAVPMIVLFLFATKPFIAGVTSGAVKG